MGVFNNFPYTNWHELNLDWFIAEFERLQSEWDSFGYSVTATAHPGLAPNVTVTGDLTNGLNFDFTLVKGDQGNTGPAGPDGNGIASVSIDGSYALTFTFTDGTTYITPSLKGPQGEGLNILDVYATLADLQTDHPVGNAGDMYLVGTAPNTVLYAWSTANNAWTNVGPLTSPQPSATTPLMDGVANNGIEFAYARGDHRHPTDTSRASASDLSALQTTVSNKADSSTVTGLANRVSTAEGNITNLQTGKQDLLINESNIKSVNGQSLLGTGSINTYIPYSTTETTTGKTWIDGKPVYRLVYAPGSNITLTENVWVTIGDFSSFDMEIIIDAHFIGNSTMPRTTYPVTRLDNGDIKAFSPVQIGDFYYMIIEYTKTTD